MAFSELKSSAYNYKKTIQEAKSRMSALNLDDKVYLNNNIEYGIGIEYEGKSKRKAPAGMLRINVARWDQIVRAAVKKTKLQLRG